MAKRVKQTPKKAAKKAPKKPAKPEVSTDLLRGLCACPTAPFVEDAPLAFVDDFAKRRKKLKLRKDRFGNRLLELPGGSPKASAKRPRLVLVAHLDHPGLIAAESAGRRTLECVFRGGVLAELLPQTKVRFFTPHSPNGEVTGRIIDAQGDDRGYAKHVTCHVPAAADVPPGTPGMFDVGEGRERGGRFHGRVCDDLAGAAAALAALDTLHRARGKPKHAGGGVAVLLTRGEEEGFVGAIAAARDGKLIRKTDNLVSIECSAEQPAAPQGGGVVIRVGDRTSVFDSALTHLLTTTAQALADEDKAKGGGFAFNRALMPGGTCEATAFDAFGYRAAAVCVPLRNYHNMDRARGKIAAEAIDLGDWRSMVRLFVRLAADHATFDPTNAALRDRLTKRFADHEHLL